MDGAEGWYPNSVHSAEIAVRVRSLLNNMMDFIEVKFWQLAIWLIRRGYGDKCSDYDKDCAVCNAHKTIEWIEGHMDLIR